MTEVLQDNDVRNYGVVDETDVAITTGSAAAAAVDDAITDEVVVVDDDHNDNDDNNKINFDASGLGMNPEHIFEHALNNNGNNINKQVAPAM